MGYRDYIHAIVYVVILFSLLGLFSLFFEHKHIGLLFCIGFLTFIAAMHPVKIHTTPITFSLILITLYLDRLAELFIFLPFKSYDSFFRLMIYAFIFSIPILIAKGIKNCRYSN